MSTKLKYTEDQLEAIEMVDAIAEFALENGWTVGPERGCHKTLAFGTLLDDQGRKLQVYYPVDPEGKEQFLFDAKVIKKDTLRGLITGELDPAAAETDAVPPTSAAHSAAHPPVPPTVPPTEGASAAHSDGAVPPTGPAVPPTEERDAAHTEDEGDVPPILGAGAMALDEDEARWIADEAKRHIKDAEDGGDTYSQPETYAAVREQQAMGTRRNWSGLVSHLSNDAILKMINGSDVTWINSLSTRRDTATVSAKSKTNHPPKITPSKWEVDDSDGAEDMRILHFLEVGGGFRSVAVARIVKVA